MSDLDNESFDNGVKPKWAKIDAELPFATKPVSPEDTGSFKPLPWSEKNKTIENTLQVEKVTSFEKDTKFDSSLIAGNIEESEVQSTDELANQERKSIFSRFSEESVPQRSETIAEQIVEEKPAQDFDSTTEKTQDSKLSATPQSSDFRDKTPIEENSATKVFDIADTDLPSEKVEEKLEIVTDTAATLPKIFKDDATEEVQPEFEAPIEINEVETTMIRRRSLMGESRQKIEEGYDDTHVRLAWQPLKQEEEKTEEEKLETILEGATVYPTLPSRAAAHWWSLFLAILLLPISWFFLNHGMARLTMTEYTTASVTLGTLEVLGATVALLIFLFSSQFSSLGAFVMGTITTVIAIPFIFFPSETDKYFAPIHERAVNMHGITEKIFNYFSENAYTGALFYFGLMLIFVGFIAHTARRQGRREQQIRNDLGLVGVDDRIAKKAKKAALKAEKAEIKAEAKAQAKAERKNKNP
ncbi:hypothetical protein HCQ94_05990 [Actinomyces sp. zg-332]|uniref:hypothetical protein n=1 Tax=Actinomyces sp. zg-332 TaxID=2708340 RepID=UPI00141DD5ED|nr:hypothetical protein [Actinomyces sp. zg-332]QPK94108.1 hypothetical protein HCQ94_05990 [Actinomyces sp. zg-332]